MNPVTWFEIYVEDIQRARRFYETVFVTSLSEIPNPDSSGFPDMQMWGFGMDFETYGASGALVYMPGREPGGSTLVYFGCEDVAVEESRITGAGGSVVRTKTAIGENGFISLIHDSEGNLIGLHSLQ